MLTQSIQRGLALGWPGTVKACFAAHRGVPGVPPWPGFWVPAQDRSVGVLGTLWVLGLFHSALQSFVQSGRTLPCLMLVKPSLKVQSFNVWLCHTSQKERVRAKEEAAVGIWGSGCLCAPGPGLSRPRRAAGGRGWPSGRSVSAAPACCSHSSSDPQTSSYPRAFWRHRCCNGFPRSSQGTGTPRPAAAEREPRVPAVRRRCRREDACS